MKRIYLICGAICLLVTGCSEKGVLKISNNTDYDNVWFVLGETDQQFLDSGSSISFNYDLNDYLLFSDSKELTLQYGGKFIVSKEEEIKLNPGQTREIEIETDAGEIIIENGTYTQHITGVFITQSVSFDDNLLTGFIGPWQLEVFNVNTGFWNIKIEPDGQEAVYFENIYLGLESTWSYTLTDE
jgi:hypothetical protein